LDVLVVDLKDGDLDGKDAGVFGLGGVVVSLVGVFDWVWVGWGGDASWENEV
jgi:hypothetical protein